MTERSADSQKPLVLEKLISKKEDSCQNWYAQLLYAQFFFGDRKEALEDLSVYGLIEGIFFGLLLKYKLKTRETNTRVINYVKLFFRIFYIS